MQVNFLKFRSTLKTSFFTLYLSLGFIFLELAFGKENDIEFDLTSSEITDPLILDPGRYLNITPPDPPTEYPSFITASVKSLHGELFTSVFNLLLRKGLQFHSDEFKIGSPYEFNTPNNLSKLIDFELTESGISHKNLVKLLESVLDYSPQVAHPYYLSRDLGAGLSPYAAMGDMLSSTFTNVLLTFYAAPVFTLMELEVTKKLRDLIGYSGGDGVTTPGTNFANILALQLAIRSKFPESKFIGLQNHTELAVFISEEADLSPWIKAAASEGISANSIKRIKAQNGRMDAEDLKAQIDKANSNGMIPLMVIAAIGTGHLGAIDQVDAIANVTAEFNGIWLHIDGSVGAPCLFSSAQKGRLAGVERSDSFTWSSSPLLGVPHTSTFLLTKTSDILTQTFSYGAKYVFATSQLYNHSYDTGDKTIQSARRPDVLKTWFMWKALGQKGLESHIDKIYKQKDDFIKLLKVSANFELVLLDFDTPFVSFTYIPSGLATLEKNFKKGPEEYQQKLDRVTMELRNKLLLDGMLVLSISSIKTTSGNTQKVLTIALTNSILTQDDMIYIRDQIQYYGEWIMAKNDSSTTETSKISLPPPEIPKPPATFDPTVSAPIAELHKSFFIYIFQLLLKKGLFYQTKRKDPSKRFKTPEELLGILDINLQPIQITHADLLKEVDKIIFYSGHHSHPFWVYQLFTGLNPYSLIADYIVAVLKPSMRSYESSPVFTLAEKELLQNIRQLIGYPQGEGDGLINPGGSFSNILSIALARYYKFPQTKSEGMSSVTVPENSGKLVFYVSIDAHYSFNKGAFLLGIGLENLKLIRTNEKGQLSIEALLEAINNTLGEGNIPFMVAATAGTTVLGSIDPLLPIAKICKEHGMWFHVDAVFGGGLIFSEKYKREKLKGIELSDSFAVNAHKMFGAAMTISCFVTRHKGILKDAFGTDIEIEASELYDNQVYDRGDSHVLGTRSSNAFKFWVLWKAQGKSGLGKHIEYVMDNAKFAVEQIQQRPDAFELIIPEYELTNICFLYIPKRFRPLNRTSEHFKIEIDPIAPTLQMHLVKNGVMDIVVQKTSGMDTPTFLKLVLMSSATNKEDIKYLLEQIDFYGQNL